MTITPPSSIPISVDYTSRDYYSIRDEMIARVQDRLPSWTANNPADFGLALVEAFSYMGDLMSFYIDRVANEAFLSTATQRDSVFNLARTYGFTPAGYKSATVSVKFTNSSSGNITVPAGTVVYGDVVTGVNKDVVQSTYFTTVTTTTVGANNFAYITAKHGQSVALVAPTNSNSYGEYIGSSDGSPNQVLVLGESPVVDGSITVYVKDGNTYSKWKEVPHILDMNPSDQVFTTFTDADNNVYIQFGNGISGLIPTNLKEIRAQYTVGGGTLGNINSGVISSIEYVPGLTTNEYAAFITSISVANEQVAIGGADPDSTEVVRYIAPLFLRANDRAVTLDDFNSLALNAGAGKANSVSGNTWTSITMYVAPRAAGSENDIAPGYDPVTGYETQAFADLETAVTDYLTPRLLIGTSLTIQPPTYVDIVLAVQYIARPQYTNLEVEAEIKAALLTDYGYANALFAQVIHQQDIEYTLNGLKSVKIGKVTVLHREGGSGINVLTGTAGEIFRIQEANISLGPL